MSTKINYVYGIYCETKAFLPSSLHQTPFVMLPLLQNPMCARAQTHTQIERTFQQLQSELTYNAFHAL